MSIALRIILVVTSIITFSWILKKIKSSKVKMEDAIFWIFFGIILLIFALIPHLSYFLCDFIGIQSPANLVFLMIIFILMMKVFTLSLQVSLMSEKISTLSAELALRSQVEEKERKKLFYSFSTDQKSDNEN